MKCSVEGCGFEGKRSDFILMIGELEIAGKITRVEVPVCYKCYFELTY